MTELKYCTICREMKPDVVDFSCIECTDKHDKAARKIEDNRLLLQFSIACLSYLPVQPDWEETARSVFDGAEVMLAEYRKRLK